MKLPVKLQNRIIDFLKSLPNIDDTTKRRAFIYSASLDHDLQNQLSFDQPVAQFVPELVTLLLKYGKLHDGRYALEAILATAQNFIGEDRRIKECKPLIEELNILLTEDEKNLLTNKESIETQLNIDVDNKDKRTRSYLAFQIGYAILPICAKQEENLWKNG